MLRNLYSHVAEAIHVLFFLKIIPPKLKLFLVVAMCRLNSLPGKVVAHDTLTLVHDLNMEKSEGFVEFLATYLKIKVTTMLFALVAVTGLE